VFGLEVISMRNPSLVDEWFRLHAVQRRLFRRFALAICIAVIGVASSLLGHIHAHQAASMPAILGMIALVVGWHDAQDLRTVRARIRKVTIALKR
jgi:hypothetical protein